MNNIHLGSGWKNILCRRSAALPPSSVPSLRTEITGRQHSSVDQGQCVRGVRGAAFAARRPWFSRGGRLTLRITLQMILLGLLLCTVLAIGIVNFRSTRQTTHLLE